MLRRHRLAGLGTDSSCVTWVKDCKGHACRTTPRSPNFGKGHDAAVPPCPRHRLLSLQNGIPWSALRRQTPGPKRLSNRSCEPASLAAALSVIKRWQQLTTVASVGLIGIGAGHFRPDPSHTTRRAGPHRAVREVEVRRIWGLPGHRSSGRITPGSGLCDCCATNVLRCRQCAQPPPRSRPVCVARGTSLFRAAIA